MRVTYVPNNEHVWLKHYNNQIGNGGLGFSGIRYQRGRGLGNIFKNIFNAILPIAKPLIGRAAKTIGKEAIHMGSNFANDLIAGENVKKALKNRTEQSVKRLTRRAAKKMTGNGIGIKKKSNKSLPLAVPQRQKVTNSNKRRKSSKKRHTDIFRY